MRRRPNRARQPLIRPPAPPTSPGRRGPSSARGLLPEFALRCVANPWTTATAGTPHTSRCADGCEGVLPPPPAENRPTAVDSGAVAAASPDISEDGGAAAVSGSFTAAACKVRGRDVGRLTAGRPARRGPDLPWAPPWPRPALTRRGDGGALGQAVARRGRHAVAQRGRAAGGGGSGKEGGEAVAWRGTRGAA